MTCRSKSWNQTCNFLKFLEEDYQNLSSKIQDILKYSCTSITTEIVGEKDAVDILFDRKAVKLGFRAMFHSLGLWLLLGVHFRKMNTVPLSIFKVKQYFLS